MIPIPKTISLFLKITLIQSLTSFHHKTQGYFTKRTQLSSSNYNYESKLQERHLKILENLFPTSIFQSSSKRGKFIPLEVSGQCNLNGSNALALKLKKNNQAAIILPIPSKTLPLLESCYNAKNTQYKPSKSQLLSLNTLLTNVDNGLFDNLPYATWSIDNVTDATGVNSIDAKYHFGKRDAYNRFLGRDWPGRSLSIGNLAQRLLVSMEDDSQNELFNQDALSKRILEIELLECRSMLAQSEYDLAIQTTQNPSPEILQSIQQDITHWKNRIMEIEDISKTNKIHSSKLKDICNKLLELNTKNPAPYRGAYGYAPYIDSSNDIQQQVSYRNPFDLLIEIITEQLNANVIGCVLENTFILDPNVIQLGGAIVLQRKQAKETVTIDGKEYSIDNEKKETNVNNVTSGDILIVECFGYEAVAMSLALKSDIFIDQELWDRLYLTIQSNNIHKSTEIDNYLIRIPTVTIDKEDQESTIQVKEQDLSNDSLILNKKPTTASLFSSQNSNPTSNIKSLQEYDSLSIHKKAKLILSLKPDSILPRPRVVFNQENELNELLLPYIDETIRREYNIRQAKRNGDEVLAVQLEQNKSKRHLLNDAIENETEFDAYNEYRNEIDVYTNVRADVTQDEGSYSSFLDKDDWYERDRLRNVKRVKRSSFGTLLDGIE